jgi:hypothetical protein
MLNAVRVVGHLAREPVFKTTSWGGIFSIPFIPGGVDPRFFELCARHPRLSVKSIISASRPTLSVISWRRKGGPPATTLMAGRDLNAVARLPLAREIGLTCYCKGHLCRTNAFALVTSAIVMRGVSVIGIAVIFVTES